MKRSVFLAAAAAALPLALVPSVVAQQGAAPAQGFVAGPPFVTTDLMTPEGDSRGTVTMMQGPNGLLVHIELSGLMPGTYAIHIHETGACTPDFSAAGGHFNPTGVNHGFMAEGGPHLGDLPNVFVPESGSVTVEFFAPELSVDPGPPPSEDEGDKPGPRPAGYLMDEDGAAVIIHAGADDYMSQPTGNAGGRIACGVLRVAQT